MKMISSVLRIFIGERHTVVRLAASLVGNRSLFIELCKVDLITRYRGSALGFFWALIQPLFLLALYTLAFGVILKARWGFTDSTPSYALMLFSGLIIVTCFNSVLKNSVSAVYGKPNFVKKIKAPLELVPLVTVVSALVDSALSIFVWFLGYLTIVGVPPVTSLYLTVIFVCFLPVLVSTKTF